jgi:hypothetical protein
MFFTFVRHIFALVRRADAVSRALPPRAYEGFTSVLTRVLRGFYENVHESFTRVLRARSREFFYEGFKSVFTRVLRGFYERVHERFTRGSRDLVWPGLCAGVVSRALPRAFMSLL